MDACFLCKKLIVPAVPAECGNRSLQCAYDAMRSAQAKGGSIRVADYEVQMFENEKICLVKEMNNPQEPKISLTNSIETAIVLICLEHRLCPAEWTFVEYANGGEGRDAYHEYDLVVLEKGNIEWRYLWHSGVRSEKEPYSDVLMINRVVQYRNLAKTVI